MSVETSARAPAGPDSAGSGSAGSGSAGSGSARPESARPVSDVLAWTRDQLEPTMRVAVGSLPASMRHLAGYHLGWWDAQGRPTAGGGKAFRPALTLLAAEAVGGPAQCAIAPAVAVELVHNFSLVHDDVMDGDATRRHRPTVWHEFGVGNAILTGDAMLVLALQVLVGGADAGVGTGVGVGTAAAELGAAIQQLNDGQAKDLELTDTADATGVTPARTLAMAERKTGVLLGSSCALGAMFAGGDIEQVERLRSFGIHLGLAFQVVDDLLGIWGDPAATGKPVYSDLRNRKLSLPVVAAITSGTPAGEELAALYRCRTPFDADELPHIADLVVQAGGRTWSRSTADDLLARADADLRAAEGTPRATAELAALAALAGRREH